VPVAKKLFSLTRKVGGGSSHLPGSEERLEEAEKVASEWLATLNRRRAQRERTAPTDVEVRAPVAKAYGAIDLSLQAVPSRYSPVPIGHRPGSTTYAASALEQAAEMGRSEVRGERHSHSSKKAARAAGVVKGKVARPSRERVVSQSPRKDVAPK